MAHDFNSVVHFKLAGHGVIPGIVLNSRLEQQPNSQDVLEVLSVLYAHPQDVGMAIHNAKDIGDVKHGLKPASDTVHFGWADSADFFDDEETPEPAFDEKPDPVTSGDPSDHMKKQGTLHKAPLNERLTPGTYLSERQTQGPATEGSVADEDLSKPMNDSGQIVGATAPEDQGGGQVHDEGVDQNPDRAVVDTSDQPAEVFADPEGRVIATPDGEGGFTNHRPNPFPPPRGKDWTGHPITERIN